MQYEIPEDFVFKYPWAPSTSQGAFCICVSCGEKSQATHKISEYPFRYMPTDWRTESRTKAVRCPQCARHNNFQPDFYSKYEVHISHDGELPHLHVRPRERMWMETGDGLTVEQSEKIETTQSAHEAVKEVAMEEEDEMESPAKDMKAKAKDHFGQVGGAMALGLKMAVVNEGGEILIDIAREIAKDSPMMEAMLESPEGREVAKMMVALTVSGMCHYTDYVPKQEVVSELMAMQMTVSGFTLAAPRMKQVRKHFERLAGLGDKLADVGELASGGVQTRVATGADLEAEEETAEVESIEKGKKKRKSA